MFPHTASVLGGSGGGGDISKLPSWAGYTPAMVDYYVSAGLLVPFYNDMQARVNSLEAGGGSSNIDIAITGSGNAVTGVSKSGNTLTFAKSSTFALQAHNHSVYELAFTISFNISATSGTVAQGNDDR